MDKAGYEFVQVTTGEPRKSLFSRAVLACATPFSLGVIVFAALGVWALNLSPDEIFRSNFWLGFIRAVRVFAPFLDDLAKNGLKIEVIAFYACAACFWLCFFAAVFCLNYDKEDFRRVNLVKLTAAFVLLGGFCFLAFSGLLFAPEGWAADGAFTCGLTPTPLQTTAHLIILPRLWLSARFLRRLAA